MHHEVARAEALVVGHQAGAGRHKDRLGALLVKLPDGTDFAIGTGFSDRERANPPAVDRAKQRDIEGGWL